jgi:hypothetical protein
MPSSADVVNCSRRIIYSSYLTLRYVTSYFIVGSRITLQPNVSRMGWKLPAPYGKWTFIIVFITAHHKSLTWVKKFNLHLHIPLSLTSIWTLPSHLCLGLPPDRFRSGFPTELFCEFLKPHTPRTCQSENYTILEWEINKLFITYTNDHA